MAKYLVFIICILCFINCSNGDGNYRETNIDMYLKQKFDARAAFIDTLLSQNSIKHIRKIDYEAGTNKSTIRWKLDSGMAIYLSSESSNIAEHTKFCNWEYQDTIYCYENCWWESGKDYEIWVYEGDLVLRYYYDTKNIEEDSGVKKFIDTTIDSVLTAKQSLNKADLVRWQKFKMDTTYNIDTFIELWNPKLKRLDKVEEWDAWYEKTHRNKKINNIKSNFQNNKQ